MKIWKYGYGLPLAALIVAACSGSGAGGQDHESDKTGTLSLELTGVDSAGEVYRLRNATFFIEGYPDYYYPSSSGGAGGVGEGYYYSASVSTETDPDAAVITHRVVPGYYYVTFDTGQPWYMEHVTPSGAERVPDSVLLSSPTQYAYVYDRGTRSVVYNFGVGGKTIDFRHGDISISIGVEHPNEGGGGAPGMGGGIGGGGFAGAFF